MKFIGAFDIFCPKNDTKMYKAFTIKTKPSEINCKVEIDKGLVMKLSDFTNNVYVDSLVDVDPAMGSIDIV